MPVLLTAALLCGCGKTGNSSEEVRAHFENLDGFSVHVKILSETDEFTMAFEQDYAYNKEDADVFTITAPESVAGVAGRISGTDTADFTLQYDDLTLDDARPVRPGLTPADAVFSVIAALKNAEPDETYRETVKGTALTALRYRSAEGNIEKLIWLREDNMQPMCAEFYVDGTREIGIQFTSYQENGG